MFRLDRNAAKWGNGLIQKKGPGPIKIEFDLYYIYLIVGLGLGRTESLSEQDSDSKELIRYYPKAYQSVRHRIATLLLYCDLKASSFDINHKKIVKSKIEEILSADSVILLSDDSCKQLNNYANGGFEAIREELVNPPSDSALFLIYVYETFFHKMFKN